MKVPKKVPTWAKRSQGRPEMVGTEGPKDRLEMVSREPTWAKKVPRID